MQTTQTTYTGGDTRRKARRGLAIYFAVVVALSAPVEAGIILTGALTHPGSTLVWITGLMAVPALASLVARLALREGFSDVSFRFGGRRGRNAILQAPILPVVVGLAAYGVTWTTGLAGFAPPPLGAWVVMFAVSLILNLVMVSGEEIGWRGYMLTRLIDAGVPRPVLASGLIWGVWHVPLVLWAGYADGPSPILSAALLMVAVPSLGYVLARTRLETGSVWAAVALHVAWNVIFQTGFDSATKGGADALWVGESGILTVIVLAVATVIYSRGRWTILREPPKRETAPFQQEGVQAQPRAQ